MATENNFTVLVKSDGKALPTVTRNGSNYIAVPHETKYEIELVNERNVQCDADVSVDGKSVGVFRISAFSRIVLQRPVHVDQAFVFVAEKSTEAAQGAVQKGASENGLIAVTFTPDTYRPPRARKSSSRGGSRGGEVLESYMAETLEQASFSFSRSGSTQDRSGHHTMHEKKTTFEGREFGMLGRGATVLGDRTNQTYVDCAPLDQPDTGNRTRIHVRLAVQLGYSPLTSAPAVSNPIPAPLPV